MISGLQSLLGRLLVKMLPMRSMLRRDSRWEHENVSSQIDADTLHSILAEARNGDTRRLFALYRDIILEHAHCQSEFSKRKLAVLGNTINFAPKDKEDPLDKKTTDIVSDEWSDLPGKREALTHLLDSSLYPVALVEKVFKPARAGSGLRFQIAALNPVPHHLLDYREGRLRIRDVDQKTGQPLETFREADPTYFIVHRGHLLTSIPDNWGGPMRAVLFWWLFGTMGREWWGRFLERYGAPFIVGNYPDGEENTRLSLERAFSAATRLFGLVIPDGAKVQLQQAQTASAGDAFRAFHDTANAEMSKLIVGQTMTSEASSDGFSGGQAKVHDRVRGDVRDFDDAALGETLRDQLLRQFTEINGLAGRPPSVSWPEADDEETAATAELLKALPVAGLQVTEEGINQVSQRHGLPLERIQAPAPPTGFAATANLRALAAGSSRTARLAAQQANEEIVKSAAGALAKAFRGSFAEVERAIRESRSPADLESRLSSFCATYDPVRAQTLLTDALAAHALNAA